MRTFKTVRIYSLSAKIQLLIGLNLYNKILDNISKDLSSKFQDNLYPNRVRLKPYFFLSNASALCSAMNCSFKTMEQVSRTYIPSFRIPITQRARRLHAVILCLLPLDSRSFQPLIIHIEETLRPSRFGLVVTLSGHFPFLDYILPYSL